MRGGLFLRFLHAVEKVDKISSSVPSADIAREKSTSKTPSATLKRKALFSADDGEQKELLRDLTLVLSNIQVWNGNKYARAMSPLTP